jgi:hypothetical protein
MGDTAGTWDAARVLQIISNLVCNAVRHGSADAPIRIIVDGTREDAVVLRVFNAGVPIPRAARPGPARAACRFPTSCGACCSSHSALRRMILSASRTTRMPSEWAR